MKKTNAEIDDSVLVQMYRDGDSNAFGTIFTRYNNSVRSYIFNIVKDNALADDLLQDVFLRALTTINELYADRGTLKGWLYTIAHNHSINYLRRRALFPCSSLPTSGEFEKMEQKTRFPVADNSQNPEEIMINMETRYDIQDLINSLPSEQKELVVLRYFHDLKFKEIAVYQGLSDNISTNRHKTMLALSNLKKLINEIESYGTKQK